MPRAQYRTGGPRSFRRRTVAPGWALTITSADFGGLGAVTETPPAGFGCASSDLDDGEVQATGQQVRFTLQGDSPSPYIVNTPSQEGVYPFSGMLRDSDRKDTPAGGDTLVVVAIDRIGRTWQDTVRSICALRDRGVKIRSLAEAEAQWTRYLEADEGSPRVFSGRS